MKYAAWYGIIIGLLMIGQWSFFLVTGQVPELQTEPLRITLHLVAEFITATGLLVSGVALLRQVAWARATYLVAAGMLLYSLIASPGYFAQQGQWILVRMFALLLLLTIIALVNLLNA